MDNLLTEKTRKRKSVRRGGPGETIFLPRGAPHSFAQLSAHGRVTYLFQPAGDMEAFFQAFASLDPGDASETCVVAVFGRHGMQVVGPPLAVEGSALAPGGVRWPEVESGGSAPQRVVKNSPGQEFG